MILALSSWGWGSNEVMQTKFSAPGTEQALRKRSLLSCPRKDLDQKRELPASERCHTKEELCLKSPCLSRKALKVEERYLPNWGSFTQSKLCLEGLSSFSQSSPELLDLLPRVFLRWIQLSAMPRADMGLQNGFLINWSGKWFLWEVNCIDCGNQSKNRTSNPQPQSEVRHGPSNK